MDGEETWKGKVEPREEGEVLQQSCLAPYLNCTVCFALAAGQGEKETLAEEEERKEQLQVVDVVLVMYLISLSPDVHLFQTGCSTVL